MDFLHASIALLASMVLVLAGMVGWLYWQQTRLFQNMNSIVMVIGELARPVVAIAQPEPIKSETEVETVEVEPDVDIDDRVSVEAEDSPKVEIVSGPEPIDTDGLESKTKKELTDMLTKRGIPYSKNDNKTTLVSLLKATA
jgi:hypothetical protein